MSCQYFEMDGGYGYYCVNIMEIRPEMFRSAKQRDKLEAEKVEEKLLLNSEEAFNE